jgi:hypothetical protein
MLACAFGLALYSKPNLSAIKVSPNPINATVLPYFCYVVASVVPTWTTPHQRRLHGERWWHVEDKHPNMQ